MIRSVLKGVMMLSQRICESALHKNKLVLRKQNGQRNVTSRQMYEKRCDLADLKVALCTKMDIVEGRISCSLQCAYNHDIDREMTDGRGLLRHLDG